MFYTHLIGFFVTLFSFMSYYCDKNLQGTWMEILLTHPGISWMLERFIYKFTSQVLSHGVHHNLSIRMTGIYEYNHNIKFI